MSKEELDECELEMHRVLDELPLDPAVVEAMRALWLQQLDMQRRARELH